MLLRTNAPLFVNELMFSFSVVGTQADLTHMRLGCSTKRFTPFYGDKTFRPPASQVKKRSEQPSFLTLLSGKQVARSFVTFLSYFLIREPEQTRLVLVRDGPSVHCVDFRN